MIFSSITPKQKKLINVVLIGFGILLFAISLLPGWINPGWGVVILIFSAVASAIVAIIIPEAFTDESTDDTIEQIIQKK